jgi:DNA-binding beta-propeller fold protein YncE
MRRKKRFSIGWLALGLAVVAMVPVTAEAKPLPTDTSHEQGMPVYVTGTLSPDDRTFSRVDSARQVEIPYLSHGVGVTPAELGFAMGVSPDDRGHARPEPKGTTVFVTDDGSRIDVNPYWATGFGLALLLLAGGMGIAIRHSRKTTLSPA